MEPNHRSPQKQVAYPHSPDAEVVALGCMLASANAVSKLCPILQEEDFFFSKHKLIFRVIKGFYSKEIPVGALLVGEELKRIDAIEAAGGLGYLAVLEEQGMYRGSHPEEFAKLVIEKATLRRAMDLSSQIHYKASQEPKEVSELIEEAQKGFFDIGKTASSGKTKEIKDVLDGKHDPDGRHYMQDVEERQAYYIEHGVSMPLAGIPTNYEILDRVLGNMGNSNLIIVAARPAMGKTAFMLNIAENVAIKQKKAVGIFSLEMSAEQLVARMMASQSEISSQTVKMGLVDGQQYQRLLEAKHSLQESTILIDDQPGISISDLRARARRWKETHNIDILIIDYLQLLTGSGSKISKENRQQEVSEISRTLKVIARELNIPVLCLSQLNRKSEERTNHKPLMSDLRESGAIEQDADVVMFLHREDYYEPHKSPGRADVIVAKNRHGETRTVTLNFRKLISKFEDCPDEPSIEQMRTDVFGQGGV